MIWLAKKLCSSKECLQVESWLWNGLHLIKSLLAVLFQIVLYNLLFVVHCAHPNYVSQLFFLSATSKVYLNNLLLDQPHLLLWSGDPLGGWGKGCWHSLPRLQQSLWCCFPQYSPEEAGSPWLGWVHNLLSKELSGRLSPESGGNEVTGWQPVMSVVPQRGSQHTWGKWCHLEGPWHIGEVGLCEPHEVQQSQVQGPVPG